ncbi:DUF5689 domain-containing protein [Flavobacteriaceae bacterium]|nr:DUF5689 domain-containing protein [Flavobacteriaceae bacterium]
MFLFKYNNMRYLAILFLIISCTSNFESSVIDTTISEFDFTNKVVLSYRDLYDLHSNDIGKDTVVVGYVVSTNEGNNFYQELILQNTLTQTDTNAIVGLKINLGISNTQNYYGVGRKVVVNLNGLRKQIKNNAVEIGVSNGLYLEKIKSFDIEKHLIKTSEVLEVKPTTVSLSNLDFTYLNRYLKIDSLYFKDIGKTFSNEDTDEYDGVRALHFCNAIYKDSILLETSTFSDFSSELLPQGLLNVKGIYTTNFDGESVLVLNTISGISIMADEVMVCPDITSPAILISEVADPKVSSGENLRYVALYNPNTASVNLKGWSLKRYNKTSKDNVYSFALDNLSIAANSSLVLANNEEDFLHYFGVIPDLVGTDISGNGDDAYALYDSNNELKDVFGKINIDGSGENWEYTDGVAKRKVNINMANSNFDINEWEIQLELEHFNTVSQGVYSPYDRE